ncbi:hypothetical protein AZE42_04438 [Rhizopogon vesiculosus]|uniref:TOG domain-containing protein n=1 Tax=Rhizopogon vesiculosus TaxID=180088 RepID=A0A1J8QS06_9AGAM|nr:hypothetical protein AZE42_04438 [Rhizopogon vesiculosus]
MSKRKCKSPSSLRAELEVVRGKVSLEETEESWDKIEQGFVQLTECCNNGGCEFAAEMVAGIRSLSRQLNHAMNSERSRLSGSAIELVTTLLAGLGPSFEPLVSLFLPTLLGLCARTNKVFTSRAKACIFAVIENTQSPSLLPYLAESVNHKSTFLRLVAAEGVLACLNCFNPPDIEKDTRVRLIEDVIRLTARDASADVRRSGKKIFEAYKALLPDRVESFVAPLTPVIKKYLEVQGTVTSRSTSQVLSRGHPTTGRARPAVSLQAQKMSSHSRATSMQCAVAAGVSGKKLERRLHPLGSELPRDIPAVRPIAVSNRVTSARQGALRPPSETGSSTMQNTSQRRDIARPLAPITQGPQRVGNVLIKPQDEKPRVGGGARRVLIPTAPLPETDNTEVARTTLKTGPPSVKPGSVGSVAKPPISKRDPKTNPVTTKVPSASAVTVRPSSQTARPFAKAEHPTTRGTNSRIGQPQSNEPPTTGVELQMSSQMSRKKVIAPSRSSQQTVGQKKPVWGGRSVTKAAVQALSIRSKPGRMKNPDASKPTPEDVPLPPSPTAVPLPSSPVSTPCQARQFELSGEPPVQAAAHDTHVPRDVSRPCIDATPAICDVHIQESPSKTPITALLSSIQRGFLLTPSSPLSPPQTYVTEVIAHTYPPDSPTARKDIACVSLGHDCTARQVLEMMDVN